MGLALTVVFFVASLLSPLLCVFNIFANELLISKGETVKLTVRFTTLSINLLEAKIFV